MNGYTRTPEMTSTLIEALRVALYANPEQRLGQLLLNAARNEDGSTPEKYRVWNIYDEKWIDLLREATGEN